MDDDAFDAYLAELDANPGPMSRGHVRPGGHYARHGDMSREHYLALVIQDDGDVIVQVYGADITRAARSASVEFCVPGTGGGRSSRVRKALLELAEAIALDNAEDPERAALS